MIYGANFLIDGFCAGWAFWYITVLAYNTKEQQPKALYTLLSVTTVIVVLLSCFGLLGQAAV